MSYRISFPFWVEVGYWEYLLHIQHRHTNLLVLRKHGHRFLSWS